MNSGLSPWIELPAGIFSSRGISAWAVAGLSEVEAGDTDMFCSWLNSAHHASMAYMERYPDLRTDPRLLLEGAKSIVCCALPYSISKPHPWISAYALGTDYHDVFRALLTEVAQDITALAGGEYRVCVDSAPLRERYWAVRSGLGMRGDNGHLIVPGLGSACFLGEILTTAAISPRCHTSLSECEHCGRCLKSCPTGALCGDGTLDARRCISYLTIEHRGEFDSEVDLHSRLYGCDVCTLVCPHNINRSLDDSYVQDELLPRPVMDSVTPHRVADMTQEEFSTIFARSPIKRAKLVSLRRNALRILSSYKKK